MPLALLLACHREPVEFPSTLAPLAENRAEWPALGEEEPNVASGGSSELWWAHARGYVQAPVADVYAALADADVIVDRREVDAWEVTADTEPRFDRSYTVSLVVDDVVTVNFDLTWVYEIQAADDERDAEGTATAAIANWNKTDGTTFIDTLRGSLELRASDEDPEITELATIEELKASLRDDQTIAAYLRDLHASIVAAAHGEPLPGW